MRKNIGKLVNVCKKQSQKVRATIAMDLAMTIAVLNVFTTSVKWIINVKLIVWIS